MDIQELTLKQIRDIQKILPSEQETVKEASPGPYYVGCNYLIRTVTNYFTGRLEWVTEQELVLSNAAWVADTGRFSEALAHGTLSEVEVYPAALEVIVGRGAVVDAVQWKHDLPTETK